MIKRKSLVVFFKNDNFVHQLDEYINVAYLSRKRKYAIIYMDENRLKGVKNLLQRTKGVISIEDSKVILEQI